MNRRAFLTATTAAATVATARAVGAATVPPLGETGVPQTPRPPLPLGPLPDSRYPDPHVESLVKPKGAWGNPGFPAYAGTMAVERVATGFRWAEGPVYFPAGRYVLFSDIPNNRIMRFSEDDGHVSVFRQPSMNSNGNTIDREGRLITCEHSGRRVTRTELDGSITVIADKYDGKRLNSPNDAVVASDGSIWFTDPVYGIGGYYEGVKATPEQEKHNVYRVDPKAGDIKVVVDDFVEPNGITFSPDEKKLYVIDTGLTDGPNNRRTSGCLTWMWRPVSYRMDGCLPKCLSRASLMGCELTPLAISGARSVGVIRTTTAYGATRRPANCSARFTSQRPSPICVLVVPSVTDCIFAARLRSTPFIRAHKAP